MYVDDLKMQVSTSKLNGRKGLTHVPEKDLENITRLLVDDARDTLYTATASETADGGLDDTLDVVAENLAVTLSAALADTLKYKSA